MEIACFARLHLLPLLANGIDLLVQIILLNVCDYLLLIVTDRNRDTQDMRPYASVVADCADCGRRASGKCVW